jgi:hypothetical protein
MPRYVLGRGCAPGVSYIYSGLRVTSAEGAAEYLPAAKRPPRTAMASSKATSVAAYLEELPADRRKEISVVRDVIRKNLPAGYEETMNFGMITYEIPLSRYPKTYNKKPLEYVALSAQKNYNAIYLMGVYGDAHREKKLRDAFTKEGKKLDMGKSCLRFKSAGDLALEAIGEIVAGTTVNEYIAKYEAARKK